MPTYLTPHRIAVAIERLSESRAKRSALFDFLVVKRTLALSGQPAVAITETAPQFIQALDELGACGEYQGTRNVEERIVRERLAIATATPEVQDALKRGRMKPSAAACIAKLASDRQRQILEKSPNKITTRTISEASGKRRKPTAKELRTYIETTRDDTTASHTVREFCDRLVRQMSGEEPLT